MVHLNVRRVGLSVDLLDKPVDSSPGPATMRDSIGADADVTMQWTDWALWRDLADH